LPTITTQGETSDVAHIDRDSVLLCPPKDPEAIAAAIEELIDDPELRKRLHLGALDLARKWFSWESATARTVSTLQ
jgi:glycosyltransferase involved in cell wall biosynthesis